MKKYIKKSTFFLAFLILNINSVHATNNQKQNTSPYDLSTYTPDPRITNLEQQMEFYKKELDRIEQHMDTVDYRIETAKTIAIYTVIGLAVISISLLIYDKWFAQSEKPDDINDKDATQ